VQDEVVRNIVAALEVRLKQQEVAAIERVPTTSLEAYDHYMRAEEQRLISNESARIRRALIEFQKAIALDPDFAEAHAGYARTAVEVWRRSFSDVMPGVVARKEAYEEASKALAIDPGNARAHVVLSLIQAQEGAHESAIASARQAVALQPNDAEARGNLALILSFDGKTTEASAEMAVARQLDPALHPDLLVMSGQVAFATMPSPISLRLRLLSRAMRHCSKFWLQLWLCKVGPTKRERPRTGFWH
jgi:adenylate cyclase